MFLMPSSPSHAVFRALADPTRRQILAMLRDGPRTSGEIASRFESSWPTISRHLAVLHDGGLVVARRRGQEIHYELNTSVFQDLAQHLMEWVTPADARPARRRRRVPKPQEV
jgi:DNA-binding transcriptional ArsR family regulator